MSIIKPVAISIMVVFSMVGLAVGQEKVLSPSSDQSTKKRIQDATGQNVDSELAGANQPAVDPSEALVSALNTMIPIDVQESDLKGPLLEISKLFLEGKIQDSVKKLDELRETHGELPPAPLLVSGMLFTAGQANQARLWLEQAAIDSPEYPTVYTGFARIALTEKRITDAIALLEKAQRTIEGGSWNESQTKLFRSEYLDGLTDVAINRQKLEEARGYLLELQEMLPNNARIPLRLAQIEFDLDRIDASLEYLNKTRELAPNLRRPAVILSDWLLRKNKLNESEQWIVKAATDFPNDANVQLDYGKWLLRNERLLKANEAIMNSEKLGGDRYQVTFLKGQIAFARRAYDVAEMHFEELNRMRPGDGDATNMLSLSLIESNDANKRNKALEIATINQRVYPRSPTAMSTLGWIYYRLGRMQEAQNAFKQVIAARNLEPAAAFFVASYLQKIGQDQANAIQLLKQALQAETYFMFRSRARDLLATLEAAVQNDSTGKDSENAAGGDSDKKSDGGKSGDGR